MSLASSADVTTSCASPCQSEPKDRSFIMDFGSGHDLISATRVDRMDLSTYESSRVNFHTANGITSTTTMVGLDFDTFNVPAKAHVLDDAPSVLPLGKRCMEQGGPVEENPT